MRSVGEPIVVPAFLNEGAYNDSAMVDLMLLEVNA
jgi:hypothetical protein